MTMNSYSTCTMQQAVILDTLDLCLISLIKTDHVVGLPSPMANTNSTQVPSPTQYSPNSGSYRCPVLQCQLRLGNREDFDMHIKIIHHLNLKFRDDDASNDVRQLVTEATDTPTPFHKQKPDILANPFHNQIKKPDLTGNPFEMQNKNHDIKANPHNQNKQPDIPAHIFQNQNMILDTTENPFHSQIKQDDVGSNLIQVQNKKSVITIGKRSRRISQLILSLTRTRSLT